MGASTPLNDILLEALRKAADGRAFALQGPAKLYAHAGHDEDGVQRAGGKTIQFNGGTELLFKGVRTGTRSPFIFEFEQMDSDEWPVIDIESKKVEQILPKLAGYLYEVIAKAGGFEDEFTSGWTLQAYLVRFANAITDKLRREEAEAAAEAAVVQSERYADNEAWGQW